MVQTYRNLYSKLCSFQNLHKAFKKAAKNKRNKRYVVEFELNLENELLDIKSELKSFTYRPHPLKRFVIRDPKTREISAPIFRDRVVHHALCSIIEPIFNRTFIFDSYANRKHKGTLAAILKFDEYMRKVSKNGRILNKSQYSNQVCGYALKADIKHYFNTVDHGILLEIIKRKIKDEKIIRIIEVFLKNYSNKNKGMPLGDLTSQFFANVYLNELDQFVKNELKAKWYIRYVDDFVILHESKEMLKHYKNQINKFLRTLKIELHPDKTKIISLSSGIKFLGFRIFYYYKLPTKNNIQTIRNRIKQFKEKYEQGSIYEETILESLEGWGAYAMHADTYNLRNKLIKQAEEFL